MSILDKGGEPKALENVVLTNSEIQVEKENYQNEIRENIACAY